MPRTRPTGSADGRREGRLVRNGVRRRWGRRAVPSVAVLRALSDPTRLALTVSLADGQEQAWGDLQAPVAKSTLSHHLSVLHDAGVTTTRQEGRRCFVRLRRDELESCFPGLLDTILAAARTGS